MSKKKQAKVKMTQGKALGSTLADPRVDATKGKHDPEEGDVGNEIVACAGHAVDPAVLRGAPLARRLPLAAATAAHPGEGGGEAVLRGGVAADVVISAALGARLCQHHSDAVQSEFKSNELQTESRIHRIEPKTIGQTDMTNHESQSQDEQHRAIDQGRYWLDEISSRRSLDHFIAECKNASVLIAQPRRITVR